MDLETFTQQMCVCVYVDSRLSLFITNAYWFLLRYYETGSAISASETANRK